MPQSLIHTSQVTRKAKQSNSTGAILSIKNYGLEVILNALGLSECSLGQSIHQPTGPVLIAIDAENMSNKSQLRSANCQVGLAIFDPHWLGNALGVPTNFRHCAGNDAHFTLVALLGLACFRPRSNSQSWHKLSSSFQKLRASIVDITLPVGSCREDMKKKEERRKCRRLENERNRELKRALRTAAKEAVAGHDWSAMLQETDLEKPRDQVRART
jgi:hypothetical protein